MKHFHLAPSGTYTSPSNAFGVPTKAYYMYNILGASRGIWEHAWVRVLPAAVSGHVTVVRINGRQGKVGNKRPRVGSRGTGSIWGI